MIDSRDADAKVSAYPLLCRGEVPWPRLRIGPPRVGKQPRRRFGRSLQAGSAIHRKSFGRALRDVCMKRLNIFGRSLRPIFADRFALFGQLPKNPGANRANIFTRWSRTI